MVTAGKAEQGVYQEYSRVTYAGGMGLLTETLSEPAGARSSPRTRLFCQGEKTELYEQSSVHPQCHYPLRIK